MKALVVLALPYLWKEVLINEVTNLLSFPGWHSLGVALSCWGNYLVIAIVHEPDVLAVWTLSQPSRNGLVDSAHQPWSSHTENDISGASSDLSLSSLGKNSSGHSLQKPRQHPNLCSFLLSPASTFGH